MKETKNICLPIFVIVNIFPDGRLKYSQVLISSWISKVSSPPRLHWSSQNFRDIHQKKYLWCILIMKLSLPVALLVLLVFKYPVNCSPNVLLVELLSTNQFLVRDATSLAQVLQM